MFFLYPGAGGQTLTAVKNARSGGGGVAGGSSAAKPRNDTFGFSTAEISGYAPLWKEYGYRAAQNRLV